MLGAMEVRLFWCVTESSLNSRPIILSTSYTGMSAGYFSHFPMFPFISITIKSAQLCSSSGPTRGGASLQILCGWAVDLRPSRGKSEILLQKPTKLLQNQTLVDTYFNCYAALLSFLCPSLYFFFYN